MVVPVITIRRFTVRGGGCGNPAEHSFSMLHSMERHGRTTGLDQTPLVSTRFNCICSRAIMVQSPLSNRRFLITLIPRVASPNRQRLLFPVPELSPLPLSLLKSARRASPVPARSPQPASLPNRRQLPFPAQIHYLLPALPLKSARPAFPVRIFKPSPPLRQRSARRRSLVQTRSPPRR